MQMTWVAMNICIRCICGIFSRKITRYTINIRSIRCIYTVLTNPTGDMGCHDHIYTVYMRSFWHENHQIYGQIRCIYTVLANPTGDMGCHDHIYTVYMRSFGQKITKYVVMYSAMYAHGSGQPYRWHGLPWPHIYGVYAVFLVENHEIYGHIRCMHTVLANPTDDMGCHDHIYVCVRCKQVGLTRTVYIHRIWPYIWWFPCQKYRICSVYILVLANPTNKVFQSWWQARFQSYRACIQS